MSSPKEAFTSFLIPLADMERNLKKPFIEAGLPDIPLPAEMMLKLAEVFPEMFPLPIAERLENRKEAEAPPATVAMPVKRFG